MSKHELEIDGILVEIHRKPIKNMHFRVYPPDGLVKVTAPLRVKLDLIRKQLEARLDWIHSQRKRLTQQTQVSFNFINGEQLEFLGQAYTLFVQEEADTRRPTIAIDGKFIRCLVRPDSTIDEKKNLLQGWYRQQMKTLLPTLITNWEPILNVKVNTWGIKTMKTRWGSCNIRAQRIWLNLNLIKKPFSCLEYVLIHEMVHLLEANHSQRFYTLMDKFLPQWREQQKILEPE